MGERIMKAIKQTVISLGIVAACLVGAATFTGTTTKAQPALPAAAKSAKVVKSTSTTKATSTSVAPASVKAPAPSVSQSAPATATANVYQDFVDHSGVKVMPQDQLIAAKNDDGTIQVDVRNNDGDPNVAHLVGTYTYDSTTQQVTNQN